MRILLVHNRYKSNNVGGEDVVFDNELKLLRKKLGDKNVYLYQVSNDDINKFKLMFSIFFSFGHYRNIRRIIADNGVDLVHVHNIFPLLTGSVLKAAKDAGAKVVLTLHNYRLWCISGVFYRSICGACEQCAHSIFSVAGIKNRCYRNSFFQSIAAQSALWFYWKSGLFDCVNYFFILTEFQKAKVVSLGVDKKKVILKPNGVDINNINNINNLNNYIYVSRLDESKGIVDLLECWLELDDKFCLTVIGEGPMKLDLIKLTTQREFLIKMGILQRAEILSKNASFSKKTDIYFRLKRLIDKNEMGLLFKVLFATKKINKNPVLGF